MPKLWWTFMDYVSVFQIFSSVNFFGMRAILSTFLGVIENARTALIAASLQQSDRCLVWDGTKLISFDFISCPPLNAA
jgi:hypothetical protein